MYNLIAAWDRNSSSIIINAMFAFLTVRPYTVCYLSHEEFTDGEFDYPWMVFFGDPCNSSLLPFVEQGCSAFVVDHTVALQFLDCFIALHDEALYCNVKKVVVFNGLNNYDQLVQIQQHPAVREILIVVAILVEQNSSSIWRIDSERIIKLGKHTYGTSMVDISGAMSTLYIDLLNGRSLKMDTFEVMPVMKLVPEVNGNTFYKNETYILDGLDGIIATGFCRRFNCTWELSLNQEKQYGQLYPNGSADGMIGALFERRVDLAIGGVSVWHHLFPYFTFTATLQRVGINCLTPRPRVLPSWLTLVNAFTDVVWVVFVVCFACNSLALYFITKRKEPFYAVQQVFAALLLQGTTLRKRSFSEVIFTISILMTANNLALIYLGKEASMRNFPQQSRSIETIDELADSGLHWNAPHEAWKYSLLTSENPSVKVLLNTFQVLSPSTLAEKADEGKENFAFVRLNFGHYMFGPWISEGNIHFYRPMSEDIYWEHETVWTTKTWPFLEPFNRHITVSVEAGLQQYEELVLAKKYLSYTVQIEIEHSRDRLQRQPSALEFSDVYGILVLLLMGLGASFLAFVVETVWYKSRDPH